MATKHIVCVLRSDDGHGHILQVGIGTKPRQADYTESIATVRKNIADGDTYYTTEPNGQTVALVDTLNCACGVKTIKTRGDGTTLNNLDKLGTCL